MASSINADNGVVSGSSGLKSTADTSGVLALQSNGSTGVTLNTDLSVTFAGAQTLSAGTANGVTYLNGSKVLTSGSALTFDGTTVSSPVVQSTNGTITTVLSYSGGNSTGVIGTTSNHSVEFRQNNTEGMRLTSTGLGIGTSSPSTKLHVVGANTGNRGQLCVQSDSAGNEARITLYDGTDNIGEFGTSGTSVYAYSGGNLLLYAGGTQRFVVGSSGQFGVGTSPSYGTSGQVLTSGGSGAAPTWSTPAAGGFSNIAVFTGSGTWSIPAGITKCKVTVTGAGGGGGTYAGGSGGTAISVVTLSGSTATITVGSGGSATGSGYAGSSSFVNGSTTITAYGGQNGNTGSGYSPTSGGYATGGDINISGAGGSIANNGAGAGSYWGGGGGSGAGAYGSGGAASASYYSSQAGNSGIVVIEY